MKLGLYLDGRKTDDDVTWSRHYGEILEVCRQAEDAGADSVWLTEHHRFPDGYLPQPLTLAAAIATRTSRIRIGTAVLLAPLRHTVHIAEEAALVDILSDGRLDLGLGAGYLAYEFEMFGTSPHAPMARLFEQIGELRRLFEERLISPLPVQSPLPIWVGSQGPVGARRAGRIGAPLLSIRQDQVAPYREGLTEGGFDPSVARMSGHVNVFLSDDPERDRAEITASFGYLWDTYAAAASSGHDRTVNAPADMDEALRLGLSGGTNGLTIATPQDAARLITDYIAGIPVDTMYSWAMPPGVPEGLRDRHIQLWTGVLPGLLKEEEK